MAFPPSPDPDVSPLLASATFEAATESLAAYLGFWQRRIFELQKDSNPTTADELASLIAYRDTLLQERKAITPANQALIAKALHVYGPLVRALMK